VSELSKVSSSLLINTLFIFSSVFTPAINFISNCSSYELSKANAIYIGLRLFESGENDNTTSFFYTKYNKVSKYFNCD